MSKSDDSQSVQRLVKLHVVSVKPKASGVAVGEHETLLAVWVVSPILGCVEEKLIEYTENTDGMGLRTDTAAKVASIVCCRIADMSLVIGAIEVDLYKPMVSKPSRRYGLAE